MLPILQAIQLDEYHDNAKFYGGYTIFQRVNSGIAAVEFCIIMVFIELNEFQLSTMLKKVNFIVFYIFLTSDTKKLFRI